MRIRSALLPVLTVFFLAGPGRALAQATLPSGPQVLTFYSDVDDTEQPYAVYIPERYDPSKRYPLVVSLHGAGSNHRLNLKRVFGKSNAPGETDVEASRYFPEWKPQDYIVAAPYARGTMGYQGVAEKDVLDVLADVKRRFSIDEDRTYLTGLSMGGGGTLWIGLTRPDLWAAIAPVCPAPPEGTEVFAPNALNLPIHIHQGGADPAVKPEGVRAWVQRLKDLGTPVGYTEYPGVLHDSWVNAYADGQIFDWFGQFRRNPFPERVRFATDRYRYREAYWVRLDALTPGTPASIDVRFTADDRIEVAATGLDGFTLRLAGHPRYTAGRTVQVEVDGTALQAPAADSVSFSRQGGRWVVGRAEAQAGAKRPGLEGPVGEALAGRHLYVYGTAGEPSESELAARRQQAEKAAEWSVYRGPFLGRVLVFPRVVADKDVRPSDLESAHLILFGTKETNTLIADYAPRLPLHLSGDGQAYGLLYTVPVADRYVVVSSGLPWWTPPARQGQGGLSAFLQMGIPAMMLRDVGDYLLFKGTPDQVIAAGRFDPDWRLPPAEAEKMRASGAVTLAPGAERASR